MSFRRAEMRWSNSARLGLAILATSAVLIGDHETVAAQANVGIDYRVLATAKTSTMEKELNEGAEAGFRFQAVMGGDTAIGGSEVVAVMSRTGASKGRFRYKLLATSKTSTMEKELQHRVHASRAAAIARVPWHVVRASLRRAVNLASAGRISGASLRYIRLARAREIVYPRGVDQRAR
jgi:hypothetical protein